MICIKCGAQLPDGVNFCIKCGAAQNAGAEGRQPVQPEPYAAPAGRPAPERPPQPEQPPAQPQQPYSAPAYQPVQEQPQPSYQPQYSAQGAYQSAPTLKKESKFVENWLTLIALAAFFTVTLVLSMVEPVAFSGMNARNVLLQFCVMGAVAMGTFTSMRTGGLDLSLGAMMALAAMIFGVVSYESNAVAGFFLALVACGALGLLNGLFIMVLRVPAILVTLVSATFIRAIAGASSDGATIPIDGTGFAAGAGVVALLAAIGLAILALWRTGRFAREKGSVRGEKKYFWVYGLVAVIGAFAGWAMSLRLNVAAPFIGSEYQLMIVFIFAVVAASALFKNNWLAMAASLVAALLWAMHQNALALVGMSSFSQTIDAAVWVLIMLAVFAIAKGGWKKAAGELLSL